MKLQQSQVWKVGAHYILIVAVERLTVDYKKLKDLKTKEGSHHHATKKEFCALIKKAELISPQPVLKTLDKTP